jgi:hypothetical protein
VPTYIESPRCVVIFSQGWNNEIIFQYYKLPLLNIAPIKMAVSVSTQIWLFDLMSLDRARCHNCASFSIFEFLISSRLLEVTGTANTDTFFRRYGTIRSLEYIGTDNEESTLEKCGHPGRWLPSKWIARSPFRWGRGPPQPVGTSSDPRAKVILLASLLHSRKPEFFVYFANCNSKDAFQKQNIR